MEGTADDNQHVRLDDFLYQLKALQDALNCIDREIHGSPRLYYRVENLSHASPATVKLAPVLRPQFRKPGIGARYSHSIEAVHHRFFKSLHAIRFEGAEISETREETLDAFSELVSGLGNSFSSGAVFNSSENIPLDPVLHENLDNLTKAGFISRGDVTGQLLSISFARGNKFYLYPRVGPTSIACHFSDELEKKARACIKRSVRVHGKKFFRPNNGLPFKVEVESIEELTTVKGFAPFEEKRKRFRGVPAHESIEALRNEWDS